MLIGRTRALAAAVVRESDTKGAAHAVPPEHLKRYPIINRVVGTEPAGPKHGKGGADRGAAAQFHGVTLAVSEADGVYVRIAVECPGETGRAVLSAREQDKRVVAVQVHSRSSVPGDRITIS